MSTCSEASYYYYFVIACQNSKPRPNRHFFFNQVPHFEHCSLKKICVDRVNRNFLWGSLETTRKIHWVGSQKVTKSKEEGGLGLQEAKGRNTALLAKLNCRFHTEDDALWVRVLKRIYCSNKRLNAVNMDRLSCSQIWRAIG